jgi:hypothetical protein
MTMTCEEEWRPVVGWEALYDVSNHGRVRRDGHILIPRTAGKMKYLFVDLCNGSTVKSVPIHRMVALAWIPNPEGKPCVDHIDRNELNNHISNLRWCTRGENQRNRHSKKQFKGVCRYRGRWRAMITVADERMFLGSFDTPEEAYFIYCAAAALYHGDFACG